MRTALQPNRKKRKRRGTRWTMMSRVSAERRVRSTESSRMVARRVIHASAQWKVAIGGRPEGDGSGAEGRSVSGEENGGGRSAVVRGARCRGTTTEAVVTAATVAADVTREGLTDMERATRGRASALRLNSRGRNVTAGTEVMLRPSDVFPISTCPLWSRTDWLWSRRLRSARSERQDRTAATRARMRAATMAAAMILARIEYGLGG